MIVADRDNPEKLLIDKERVIWLSKNVKWLSYREYRVIYYILVEGITYGEIAKIFHTSSQDIHGVIKDATGLLYNRLRSEERIRSLY